MARDFTRFGAGLGEGELVREDERHEEPGPGTFTELGEGGQGLGSVEPADQEEPAEEEDAG